MGSSSKKKKQQQQQQGQQHDDNSTQGDSGVLAGMSGSSSGTADGTSAYATLSFADILEDLSSRFIVNLPEEELVSIERICFQVEQAHWFYEDFLRPLNPTLPSLTLRKFSSYLLHSSALTLPVIQRYITSAQPVVSGKGATIRQQQEQQGLDAAFEEFLKYKTRVPVCGAIILNDALDKCLLVKGWKSSATWGFPKGKINKEEPERDCAVREVYEETGFDCGPYLSAESQDYIELTMREQKIRLYIVPRIDEDTKFATQTRKEISKIAWFKLSDLPTWKQKNVRSQEMGGKFYLISPFIGKLKAWIKRHRGQHSTSNLYDSDDQEQLAHVHGDDEVTPAYDVQGTDHLKAFLGMGSMSEQQAAHIVPNDVPKDSRGVQLIEEQGDARGRQLLDLLRGGQGTEQQRPAQEQKPAPLDDREQGQAALLAALHAGAGGAASNLPPSSTNAAYFLGMLNGTSDAQQQTASARPRAFAGPAGHVQQGGAPLPAPQAQRVNEAQSLLNLIKPARLDAPPHPPPQAVLSPGQSYKSGATPSWSQANDEINLASDNREQERAHQRERLLSNLLSSSLNLSAERHAAPQYLYPQPLSQSGVSAQHHLAQQYNDQPDHIRHPPPPLPHQQSRYEQRPASQDLLAMLNTASPIRSPNNGSITNRPDNLQTSAQGATASSLLAQLSAPSIASSNIQNDAQRARSEQPSPFSAFIQQRQESQEAPTNRIAPSHMAPHSDRSLLQLLNPNPPSEHLQQEIYPGPPYPQLSPQTAAQAPYYQSRQSTNFAGPGYGQQSSAPQSFAHTMANGASQHLPPPFYAAPRQPTELDGYTGSGGATMISPPAQASMRPQELSHPNHSINAQYLQPQFQASMPLPQYNLPANAQAYQENSVKDAMAHLTRLLPSS